MSGRYQHTLRRFGSCHQQGQQRCAAMRSVVIPGWKKTIAAGHQN